MTERGQVSPGLIALFVRIRHLNPNINPKYLPAGSDVSTLFMDRGVGKAYHAVCETLLPDGKPAYDIWFHRRGSNPAPREFNLDIDAAAQFLLSKWAPSSCEKRIDIEAALGTAVEKVTKKYIDNQAARESRLQPVNQVLTEKP